MAEPGWYADPHGGGGQRWWDGTQWSEHTSPPPAQPSTQGGYEAAGAGIATPVGTAAPAASSGGGSGKVIALVAGALLLVVVIGVVGWLVLDSFGSSGDTATVEQISAGRSVDYVVEESGSFELNFDVPEGLVVIDVRGEDGFDPVAELIDPETGERIARNDDRSTDHLERFGGDRLDSLLELELEAGSYTLVVTGFAQQGGPGEVTFPVVGD